LWQVDGVVRRQMHCENKNNPCQRKAKRIRQMKWPPVFHFKIISLKTQRVNDAKTCLKK
jgi:hypothetical protein